MVAEDISNGMYGMILVEPEEGLPPVDREFYVMQGEMVDRVYDQASLTSPALINVQPTLIPPGGATMVEFQLQVPGRYTQLDHALSRL